MADNSKIEWTEATWNPIRARSTSADGTERKGWHCEHASEGCRYCYAETFNKRLGTGFDYKPSHLRGMVEVYLDEKMLLQPLKWKRARQIFVCSMTDLFADFVTDEMLDRVFAVMALSHDNALHDWPGRPNHIFQVLTKRTNRMRAYMNDPNRWVRIQNVIDHWECGDDCPFTGHAPIMVNNPFDHVWMGVSVENQAAADERIPDLLATPAAVRWLSCEPLLGPVNLNSIREEWQNEAGGRTIAYESALNGKRFDEWAGDDEPWESEGHPKIDWVVAGGESGKDARPMHPEWAQSLRDQCAAADVAFFFKQWGEWEPRHSWNHRKMTAIDATGAKVSDDVAPQDVGGQRFARVGKKAAGRLLDGKTHDAMPGRGA